MTQTIAWVSVRGGKFHRPACQPTAPFFRPLKTVCGCTIDPLNFYPSEDAAEKHTGGRLARFVCQHCANGQS